MSVRFTDRHYVPILKGKQGELDAIRETSAKVREEFTPLLEIPPIPPKYIQGQDEPVPAKSIDEHLNDVAESLTKALGSQYPAFIDGFYIEEEETLATGIEPIEGLFELLRKNKVQFIPAIGLDRVEEYGTAIKNVIAADDRGCCLRLVEDDLEAVSELEPQIKSLLKFLDVNASDVHLLIDFGPNVPSRAALPYQINALPKLKDWRTLTISSSSFPVNMEGAVRNSVTEFERREWTVWTFLRSKAKTLTRMPAFGDYAINHPIFTEIDPRIMRMSPNIRYASDLNCVVAKGEAYPRKTDRRKKVGVAPSDQYPKLAQAIMNHPAWRGRRFSWGDAFIEDCSQKKRVGSATNWRAVGTCHHIALVVQQIASLP
jgi:hypothetical protein